MKLQLLLVAVLQVNKAQKVTSK